MLSTVTMGTLLVGLWCLQVLPVHRVAPLFQNSNVLAMAINKTLIFREIPVQASFYPHQEPTVTHGVMELENPDNVVHQVSIKQVAFHAGEDRIPINNFFLYRLPDYEEIDSRTIVQPALTTSQYEVSFSPIAISGYATGDMYLTVELESNGDIVALRSMYQLTFRTP